MYRIRKLFEFEAAHQLSSAFSEACTNCIHGHSYTVEVFLIAPHLNEDRMVLDFGVLKDWIEQTKRTWDHRLLYPKELTEKNEIEITPWTVVVQGNPTAEWMAKALFRSLSLYIKSTTKTLRVTVEKVRVHETRTGWAEYEDV